MLWRASVWSVCVGLAAGCGQPVAVSPWPVAQVEAVAHGAKPQDLASEPQLAPVTAVAPQKRASEPPIPGRIVRGNPQEKFVALTFDDGPHEGFTEALVQILVAENVKATFFFIGRNVQKSPHLARLAADQGFEIGNHSMNHLRMWELGDSEVRHEIEKSQDAIESATGVRPRWFRPPGGVSTPTVDKILGENGLSLALWSADAGDYTRPWGNPTADEIYRKVVRDIQPGTVMILHDPMPGTLRALPLIFANLRGRGFQFLTLSELASRPGAVTTGSPKVAEGTAFLARNAQDRARYPFDQALGARYENSKQRTPNKAAAKGQKGQGADPSRDR